MDYHSLSLVELKQQAKGRKIKQYYIMKRVQLIQLLSMASLPQELVIEKMTIHELRDTARRRGLRGFWAMRREALVGLLFPENVQEAPTNKNQENHCKTDKHHDPQEHDTKDVRVEDMENSDHEGFQNMNFNS
jgi:hypothetical protein